MEMTKTMTEGFTYFTDYQEHYLANCKLCGDKIKATKTNGPAVADSNDNITGAFFLNLWLCRSCYDDLDISKIKSS